LGLGGEHVLRKFQQCLTYVGWHVAGGAALDQLRTPMEGWGGGSSSVCVGTKEMEGSPSSEQRTSAGDGRREPAPRVDRSAGPRRSETNPTSCRWRRRDGGCPAHIRALVIAVVANLLRSQHTWPRCQGTGTALKCEPGLGDLLCISCDELQTPVEPFWIWAPRVCIDDCGACGMVGA
jgi:hypothetical protein